ncbi:MAG: outer membrane protein OmpA-like peptidoglycan-associated protein [Salibacteraceae bacterium]|jgi:outer membrane protein OmpA-like peptidoglycan-associated protein/tetratricopeptide (TPR) repeat protein
MTELEVRKLANTASEQEIVMLSSEMIQQNFLVHADILVDRLISLKPDNTNYNYRKGYIAIYSRSDYAGAIEYFKKATLGVKKNFDLYSHKETGAPFDVYYYLGKCYHINDDLDKAREFYNLFLANSKKKSINIANSQLGLKQCDVAEREFKNPKSAIVKNIGEAINGPGPDYAPVVSLDGNSIYFTSRRKWDDRLETKFRDPMLYNYPEDIFVSYADFEGDWTPPTRLEFCVDSLNEATISVSSDERRIYVYQDITGAGDIYYSDIKDNDRFGDIVKLQHEEVNTEYWETHCTITPDGQNMYFASDRPDGYGGRDIYRIVKLPNGEWSKAQNMGPEINTPNDEDSPFIAVNNKTLYYSSNGETSMGGFDVFVTFRDDQNTWSTPTNMGFPINSTGDDIFYTTTIDGLKGYLSSFRKGGYGEKDIYEIQNDYLGNNPISSIKGQFLMIDGTPVPDNVSVKIRCTNCKIESDKEINPRIKSQSMFFAVIKRCKDYEVDYYQSGTLLRTEKLVTSCNNENEEINLKEYIGEYALVGTVADDKTLEYLKGAVVSFLDPETDQLIKTFTMDANGAFVSDILKENIPGDRIAFNIKVEKEDYLTQTFKLDSVLGFFPTLKLDYLITKNEIGIDIGAVFDLNPIYFDVDKSNIRPDAAMELDKIVKIMNENPSIKIELGSHTDCRASKGYNKALSGRRATSSAQYIKSRITNPKQIYGKGYGESKLVNDCGCEGSVVSDCSEEEHQANRRTEFKIVK